MARSYRKKDWNGKVEEAYYFMGLVGITAAFLVGTYTTFVHISPQQQFQLMSVSNGLPVLAVPSSNRKIQKLFQLFNQLNLFTKLVFSTTYHSSIFSFVYHNIPRCISFFLFGPSIDQRDIGLLTYQNHETVTILIDPLSSI